eukprot:Lithocolla_globosa_v1_NODE_982_length_2993_cov_6.794418.p3 type:complete len:137 gc:universal NODE_982_length_2993_cov_6.794418:503-93(-)
MQKVKPLQALTANKHNISLWKPLVHFVGEVDHRSFTKFQHQPYVRLVRILEGPVVTTNVVMLAFFENVHLHQHIKSILNILAEKIERLDSNLLVGGKMFAPVDTAESSFHDHSFRFEEFLRGGKVGENLFDGFSLW